MRKFKTTKLLEKVLETDRLNASMKKRKKPLIFLFLVIFTLAVGVFATVFFWWNNNTGAPSDNTEKIRFTVTRGMGASEVANKLQNEGLIKNSTAFKIYVQLTDKSDKILAGEYSLPQNLKLAALTNILLEGPEEIWVTIPEGLRVEEVAHKTAIGLGLDGQEHENFVDEFYAQSQNREGYLFPDTYLFPKDVTAEKAVSRMMSVFKTSFAKAKEVKTTNLSDNEVVILASLIEKEALGNDERPVIAGVIMNRLGSDWPLQIDASVQYQEGSRVCKLSNPNCDWWPTVTKESLEKTSPFNTYKNIGLPPSPIANPGLTSLMAASNPTATDYYFYLHDASGNIHFSKTLEEHNTNVRKYLGK